MEYYDLEEAYSVHSALYFMQLCSHDGIKDYDEKIWESSHWLHHSILGDTDRMKSRSLQRTPVTQYPFMMAGKVQSCWCPPAALKTVGIF